MELEHFMNELKVDALWALLACLGLAFISGRIQSNDNENRNRSKIGESALFKNDGVKGKLVGVKRSGLVKIEIEE